MSRHDSQHVTAVKIELLEKTFLFLNGLQIPKNDQKGQLFVSVWKLKHYQNFCTTYNA